MQFGNSIDNRKNKNNKLDVYNKYNFYFGILCAMIEQSIVTSLYACFGI